MTIPIELIIISLGVLLIVLGAIIKDIRIFKSMGAILLIVMCVVILSNGIKGIDNLTTIALASISFAIGFIILITVSFSKDNKKKVVEQEEDGRFHDND